MSLRFLLVVNLSKDDIGKILFYRTFPTVERRCKILHESDYVPLPLPSLLASNLLMRLSFCSKQFIEWRDKAGVAMQMPVVDVRIGDSEIWPIVYMVQKALLVCCLPLVEKNINKEHLLNTPSISVGFSVVLGIHNFLYIKQNEEQLKDLDLFLTLNMPFGVPSNMDPSCLSLANFQHPYNCLKKQPAWKPHDYKGKQVILLKISEFVRSAQIEQDTNVCHCEVFGQICVKADLEGTLNDVTLSVISSFPSHPLTLDSVIVHPCVQMHGAATTTAVPNLLRRLRFTPPLHSTVLLQYCSPELKKLPVQGVFKMVGEKSLELLIQLKLCDTIRNSFEYFDVTVVFFNRAPVKNLEFNTSHGVPKLSEDRHSLKWSIGSKFPKELEVAMTAKLDFLDKPILFHSDPFCMDRNAYAQINFKINNVTLSGCSIDPKSVVVSHAAKPKIIIERSVESTEYRLWNNYGDLPFPENLSSKFKTLI